MREPDVRDAIIRWCKSLFDRGLTAGSSGILTRAMKPARRTNGCGSCRRVQEPIPRSLRGTTGVDVRCVASPVEPSTVGLSSKGSQVRSAA